MASIREEEALSVVWVASSVKSLRTSSQVADLSPVNGSHNFLSKKAQYDILHPWQSSIPIKLLKILSLKFTYEELEAATNLRVWLYFTVWTFSIRVAYHHLQKSLSLGPLTPPSRECAQKSGRHPAHFPPQAIFGEDHQKFLVLCPPFGNSSRRHSGLFATKQACPLPPTL